MLSRRRSERKAANDVSIIVVAFLLCFLPAWIAGIFRQFFRSVDVPSEVVLVTTCIFFLSSLCNPIIYSIRKTKLRMGVKNVLRRIGLCGIPNDFDNSVVDMNNLRFSATLDIEVSDSTRAATQATHHLDERLYGSMGRARLNFQRNQRLSSIPEIPE